MATIDVLPPTWSSGELLSAAKLNQLSDTINALKGATLAPCAVFTRSGDNRTWWMRRRGRYLSVDYATIGSSQSSTAVTAILINGVTIYQSSALQPNGYTHVIDLNALASPPALGAWYSIQVHYTSVSQTSTETRDIRETSVGGNYTAPSAFASGDSAAALLANLTALSAGCTALSAPAATPSATWLRATDSQIYALTRRQRYLEVNYISGGTSPSVRILIDGVSANNDTTARPNGYSVIVDLASYVSVGANYSLEVRRGAGSTMLLQFFRINEAPPSDYAPSWTHGEQITTADVASFDSMRTALNNCHAVLDDYYMARPSIWAGGGIVSNPRWALHKTKRYLHYMRNGSTPATLSDPGGTQPDISVSRTTDAQPFATYDLDTIDWLAPGGLLLGYQFDLIWLDDEP